MDEKTKTGEGEIKMEDASYLPISSRIEGDKRDVVGLNDKQLQAFRSGEIELDYPPDIIDIELTNKCTLNCLICPRNQMTRHVGLIEESLFKEIVDQIIEYTHTEFLWLHQFGDPLLHPKLEELSDYATKKGLRVGISTKGVLLTEEKAKSIANSDIDKILFSFVGIEKRFEKYQRGANYEETMEKIESFLSQHEIRPHIIIELLTTPKTPKDEVSKFKERWNGKAELRVKESHNWIGDSDVIREAVCAPPESHYIRPCPFLWSILSIHYNGWGCSCLLP